jgi:hypothetical protein
MCQQRRRQCRMVASAMADVPRYWFQEENEPRRLFSLAIVIGPPLPARLSRTHLCRASSYPPQNCVLLCRESRGATGLSQTVPESATVRRAHLSERTCDVWSNVSTWTESSKLLGDKTRRLKRWRRMTLSRASLASVTLRQRSNLNQPFSTHT